MKTLLDWMADGHLAPGDPDALARRIGAVPDRLRWRRALDRSLLGLGSLALAAGVIFLVAANLQHINTFARFGALQVLLVLALASYWRWGDRPAGRAALGFGILLIGALLALVGQTYQTGADPWQLFAGWAVLGLPWVWLIRHGGVWLAWLLLVDLALARALQIGVLPVWIDDQGASLCWLLVLLHGGVWAWAEFLRHRGNPLVRGVTRLLLFLLVLIPATLLSLQWVLEGPAGRVAHPLPWVLTLVAGYALYRRHSLRMAQLAAAALSVIVVLTAVLGRWFAELKDVGAFLLLALAVVVMTGLAGRWLIGLHREDRA